MTREPKPSDIKAKLKSVAPPDYLTQELSGVISAGRFELPPGGRVTFLHAQVTKVDFSKLRFETFNSVGSRFVDCDFSRTRFHLSGGFSLYPPSTFIACRFDGADLRAMWAIDATRFEHCSFDGARIEGWQSDCGEFVSCSFATKIIRSRFSGRPRGVCAEQIGRSRNDFADNDFSRADLVDTRFAYGIDLTAQRWPTGREYSRFDRPLERILAARRAVSGWPDGPDRGHAERLLDVLGSDGYREQSEIIIRADTFGAMPRKVVEAIWRELERPPDPPVW